MKRSVLSLACITILAIAPVFSAAQVPTEHRTGELVSYTFEVPRNWEVGGRAEEQYMRELMSVDPKYKIAALSTFGVPEGAVVTVYEITLPTGEGANYLDRLVDLNVEKFRIHSLDSKRSGWSRLRRHRGMGGPQDSKPGINKRDGSRAACIKPSRCVRLPEPD